MRSTVKLWEICEIERWGSPRPIQEFLTTDENWINWIKIWDTKTQPKYIEFTQEKIKPEWVKRSRMVYPWDFILSNSMSFGRPYIMKTSWCIHDWRLVLRPDNRIDKEFLYYLLGSNFMYKKFENSASWTGVKNLNIDKVKVVEIPLPPLETQKAIVAKLDQIFAELDQTKSEIQKNLDNTDELWKSAYDRILSIKWDEKSLEDLCEIVDYRWKTPKKTDKWILLVTAKNIRKWYIDYEKSKEYISEDDYDEVMHRWLPKIWDILFTTEAPCWNVAIIDNENIALAQRVVKYRPKNKEYLNNKYLLYVLLWNEFQKKLEMHSTWWTVKWIKWKILHKLTIPVPPLSEQEKIVEHLDQVFKEVKELKSKYQSQLDNLEELKKSVLDRAFKWEMGE